MKNILILMFWLLPLFVGAQNVSTVDPKGNYMLQIKKYKSGQLNKQQVHALALSALENNDTIANSIARDYKVNFLDRMRIDSVAQPANRQFVKSFYYKVFFPSDKLIVQMYKRPSLIDSLMQAKKGTSEMIYQDLITRDYINNIVQPNGKDIEIEPDWKQVQSNITRDFDARTAKRLVLNSKISWAFRHKRFDEFIRFEFERIDKYGMDTTGLGRAYFNNMIYEVVFKNVSDVALLKKAAFYMKYINELDSNSTPNHLDTYASILYKAGEKKQAVKVEKSAIESVQKKLDLDSATKKRKIKLYTRTIEYMQQGKRIWEMELY